MQRNAPKIAFIFLTKDDLLHNGLWEQYFKDQTNYTIYCHPSNSDTQLHGILKNSKIKAHHKTSWGNTALAHQSLLAAALKDKDNYKIILCSESCVPIRSFDDLYTLLTRDNYSYIKQYPVDDRILKERIIDIKLDKLIFFKKHAANYCLNRNHAYKIATTEQKIIKMFHRMTNGDEHFLSILWDLDHEETIKDIWTVYSDWDYTNKLCDSYTKKAEKEYEKYQELKKQGKKKEAELHRKKVGKMWSLVHNSAKHPKQFDKITPEIFDKIKQYYIVRKFTATSNIGEYI